MAIRDTRAGGRATESGMSFQAGVGAWFAGHLATATPIGTRFGLKSSLPVRLQFETGRYLDDIEIDLADGDRILVQCKTTVDLSARSDGALSKTIAQLVSFYRDCRRNGQAPDPTRVTAVLAVGRAAPASLDELERACRFFDHGARWSDALETLPEASAKALAVFADAVRESWSGGDGALSEHHLAALARLFRIVRFAPQTGEADRLETARLLGGKLLDDESAGLAATDMLEAAVRQLVASGAPTDGQGLLNRLRTAGLNDRHSPIYDRDIEMLTKGTRGEIARLSRHARLHGGSERSVTRECMPDLDAAIDGGSLLVIGEPGAGKTGVLVMFAEERSRRTAPLVFLSTDRLGNVATADQLRMELGLQHGLLEILENWPGTEPGVLLIDALDASRGGQSERVFANLIEDAIERLSERWSVVASIRTFDLKNGVRFRGAVSGDPPSSRYSEPTLKNVRHFLIPNLTDRELDSLADVYVDLGRLVSDSSPSLRELLRNVFNLSLAAELVRDGEGAGGLDRVDTQSDLIDRYEDARLTDHRLQRAVLDVVSAMVDQNRLVIRTVRIGNADVEEVLRTGVLASPAVDLVSFSHHVLFDHAAGRFLLHWDRPELLVEQLSDDPSTGLLLGPALRFAVERIWRSDDPARTVSWRLMVDICARTDLDSVTASTALRTAVERVASVSDIEGLLALLAKRDRLDELGAVTVRLARFVGMRTSTVALTAGTALAWATLALEAARLRLRAFAETARLLLWVLQDIAGDGTDDHVMVSGEAARELLSYGWSGEGLQPFATQAIRFVGRSYATDKDASRELLARILVDPQFTARAHEEAAPLAECVLRISEVDPDFGVEIYECLFARGLPDDTKTWLGGHPSRIMPLSATRRQEYEHARWRLTRAFPSFMAKWPEHGTRAASAVAQADASHHGRTVLRICLRTRATINVVTNGRMLQDWRVERSASTQHEVLTAFEAFLRQVDAAGFHAVVDAASRGLTATRVWARILGIGGERADDVKVSLWPVATSPELLRVADLTRDAAILIGAVYPSRSSAEIAEFEEDLIRALAVAPGEEAQDGLRARRAIARVLHQIGDAGPVTSPLMQLKVEMEEAGELLGNHPYMSVRTYAGSSEEVPDHLLTAAGADLSSGVDKAVREVGREIEAGLRTWPEPPEAADVSSLWASVRSAVGMLDTASAVPVHREVERSAWGYIGNAVERLAGAASYSPDGSGHPSLGEMLQLVDRLAARPSAEEHDEDEEQEPDGTGLIAWGNWDVRVYAASAIVHLASRFGGADPSIVARMQRFVTDPGPAVRLQVAQSLNALWGVADARMWESADWIADEEMHPGVIAALVNGPLRRLSELEPDRVEELVSRILPRIVAGEGGLGTGRGEPLMESVAGLATRLWIGRGRPAAGLWVDHWLREPVVHDAFLWTFCSALRAALFERWLFPAEPDSADIQKRAHAFAETLAQAACLLVAESREVLLASDASSKRKEDAKLRFGVGSRLLDHLTNQFYFGSGAFRQDMGDDPSGLETDAAKVEFLQEYGAVLDAIGLGGGASTLHHLLELYEHLVDADPEGVFDKVATLLVGQGRAEEYHREGMGADAVVRLVRRYLADHRAVFDDGSRRIRLLELMKLFSGAGWPEAMALLYELPDLLR